MRSSPAVFRAIGIAHAPEGREPPWAWGVSNRNAERSDVYSGVSSELRGHGKKHAMTAPVGKMLRAWLRRAVVMEVWVTWARMRRSILFGWRSDTRVRNAETRHDVSGDCVLWCVRFVSCSRMCPALGCDFGVVLVVLGSRFTPIPSKSSYSHQDPFTVKIFTTVGQGSHHSLSRPPIPKHSVKIKRASLCHGFR